MALLQCARPGCGRWFAARPHGRLTKRFCCRGCMAAFHAARRKAAAEGLKRRRK